MSAKPSQSLADFASHQGSETIRGFVASWGDRIGAAIVGFKTMVRRLVSDQTCFFERRWVEKRFWSCAAVLLDGLRSMDPNFGIVKKS